MWYQQEYTVRFRTLLRSVGIIFDETYAAIFTAPQTDFFAVLLVGVMMFFFAGLFCYLLRQSKKM